jgi:hypothetical protein
VEAVAAAAALADSIPATDSVDLAAATPAEAAPRAIGNAMDDILNQLVKKLQKAYGDRLVSVVLYGSAVIGDHHQKFSDYNILCVLNRVTPAELGASEDIFRWWREKGSPSPLLLSEHEVQTCTDCFAIEFHDIKARHRVLHGRDVIAGLEVDDSFYRAQVEHELRAKLLRLRQKASGILSEKDMLRRLLADSLSTFCVLFRHALILTGNPLEGTKRDVITQSERVFGIDPLPFQKLLDLREEKIKPRELDPVPLLESYLEGINRIIDVVDRIAK